MRYRSLTRTTQPVVEPVSLAEANLYNEDIIHAEVRKLYPDAELPSFIVEYHDADRLVLLYQSPRHFEDLAEGLMHGCVAHFKEPIRIIQDTTTAAHDAQRFVLTRHA